MAAFDLEALAPPSPWLRLLRSFLAPQASLARAALVESMLTFLSSTGRTSDRKLRLFASACYRRIRHLVRGERNLRAIELVELFADGLARKRELRNARRASQLPWLSSYAAWNDAIAAIQETRTWLTDENHSFPCIVLRDLTGPSTSISIQPAWRCWEGRTIPRLASAAYKNRLLPSGQMEPTHLNILADALEEAARAQRRRRGSRSEVRA